MVNVDLGGADGHENENFAALDRNIGAANMVTELVLAGIVGEKTI